MNNSVVARTNLTDTNCANEGCHGSVARMRSCGGDILKICSSHIIKNIVNNSECPITNPPPTNDTI